MMWFRAIESLPGRLSRRRTVVRPSLLAGNRHEWRTGKEIVGRVDWLFPSGSDPVHAAPAASALVRAAPHPVPAAQGLTDLIAKFCSDCCQISTVVLPGVGKFGTATSLEAPARNSPEGTTTLN